MVATAFHARSRTFADACCMSTSTPAGAHRDQGRRTRGGQGRRRGDNRPDAHAAIDAMLVNAMGDAGARVIVEEFLAGEEASFIVMVDGKHVLPLASSQDHKRLQDGDAGPNTGGMGAYSPAPVVTPELHARIMREIILPTVNGMAADGIPFTGFLYAGVMIDGAGQPKVLEFNCRMGDPETQPIMVRLKSDLVELVDHAVSGTLDSVDAAWDRRIALGVVLAAAGYPDHPRKGDAIEGLERITAEAHPDVVVFHAGTALAEDRTVVSGGRVLCVTALADSVRQAQRAAYAAVAHIGFDGMQFRTDIAIARWRGGRSDAPVTAGAGSGRDPEPEWTPTLPARIFSTCRRASSPVSRRLAESRSAVTNGRGPRAAAAASPASSRVAACWNAAASCFRM
jgi:phosphoribosylamine--glycine ligase